MANERDDFEQFLEFDPAAEARDKAAADYESLLDFAPPAGLPPSDGVPCDRSEGAR